RNPPTVELRLLARRRCPQALFAPQSDLELVQIVVVTYTTVAPGEREDRWVVVDAVAIGVEDLLGGDGHRGAERLAAGIPPVEPADEVRAREIGEDQGLAKPQGGMGECTHMGHVHKKDLARI